MNRITEVLRLRRAVGIVSALALMLFGATALITGASGATLASPGCGATISSDTTLSADVGPCNEGDGLRVIRDATLDLNGHKVFSTAPLPRNSGVADDGTYIPADVVGIRLDDARGATVKNGSVQRFSAGVSIEDGRSNTVQNVTARDNIAPCIGEDFSTQAVGTYGDGIVMFGSINNKILDSKAVNNGPFSGISIVGNTEQATKGVPPYPAGNLIQGNLVDDNNHCFGEIGIRIEGPGANHNTVADNLASDSYLEGIAVLATNQIDLSGAFADPPTCQNRGFPDPSLPQCPLLDPLNPTNNDNVLERNTAVSNGFGGPQTPAGPGPDGANSPSPQSRAGIQLLSFCGYGVDNGVRNTIEQNYSTLSAGNGVAVGGCPANQKRSEGRFRGFRDSTVVRNVSTDSNQRGCGVLPPRPGCGRRPTTPRYDLLDTSNVITCPSTNAAVQDRCAAHGFTTAPPPSPTPFVGTLVVDRGPACDNNAWFRNDYRTARPPCTTFGGQVIPPSSEARPQSGKAAATEDASSAQNALPPLRGPGPAGISR